MPRSRRSPNRIVDDVLTDDTGNQWHRMSTDLSRAAIERLLAEPDVRVAVHAERRLLRWVPTADRRRVWTDEIEPRFHDHASAAAGNDRGADASDGAPPLPFHATLWRRRGNQMLVFDDFD